MPDAPTLRSLARQLGLSVATVSEALRDSLRVKEATRARVKRAARRAGYRANPLLGAALSAIRCRRHQRYRGTLALIEIEDDNPGQYAVFHREIGAGAGARARQLGFQTEQFWLGPRAPALPVKRLPAVLFARGIAGVVLLPFNQRQDLADFDFSRLAAVQMDHSVMQPRLHTVLPDHYVSMTHALERLQDRGYRHIGLCLEERKDERIKRKWSAAFQAFFRPAGRGAEAPLLIAPQLNRTDFAVWFNRHRPDMIVGHEQAIVEWLADMGRRVPADVGFFRLNLTESTAPCAGLDLDPRRLGAVAIETVVAMLHRQERGVPVHPQAIELEAVWVEGPTIRGP